MELCSIRIKGFCCFEDVLVNLHKQGLVWIGGKNKDSDAASSNGSGKTTLMKAITWALYGDTIDGYKGDAVIKRGAKKASCELELIGDDGTWKVIRERSKGAPKLSMVASSGEVIKSSKGDIQETINAMVGLDFKAFKNTVLYGQNDTCRFIDPNTTDSERKDTLHKIMRLDVLQQCHELAKAKSRDVKSKLDENTTLASTIKARMEEHDTTVLEGQKRAWDNTRQERLNHHKKLVTHYKEQAEVESAKAAQAPLLKKKLIDINTEIAKLAEAKEKVEKAQSLLEKIEEQRQAAQKQLFLSNAEINNINGQLEHLEGDTCPLCTSPLTEGVGGEYKGSLFILLEEHRGVASDTEKVMKDWAAKATMARDRIKKLKEGASAESGLRSEATELVAGIAAATAAVERSEMLISVARKELESVKAIKAEVNPYTEQLAVAKAALKQFQDQLAVLSEQQTVLLDEQAHIEFWTRGFSNQGLPSYVLDSVMPFITTRTNHYLNTLADGDIVMRFDTQRILKSKKDELRDEIDISWQIEGIDDNPPPSGGQFKKMEIATDLSLMDLVASREGKHLDILMMDEVLDGLDDEGRQRVLQLLHALRSRRGTIFVISHEVDMAEIFEKSIVVTKEGGTSTLEVRK